MVVLDFQFKAKQRAISWDLSAIFKDSFPIFFLPVYLFLFWPDTLIEDISENCSLCISPSLQKTGPLMIGNACKPLRQFEDKESSLDKEK